MKASGKHVITPRAFDEFVRTVVGLPVSHAWRGYGSALFLELGELGPADPPPRSSSSVGPAPEKGEAGVTIQWSWRIERARSIEVGSWSSDARINTSIARLAGPRVVSLAVEGRLPDLVVGLSDGRSLRSFMTAEGQPQWTVFLRDGSWLTVERGRIIHDRQNQVRPSGADDPVA